MLQSDLVSVVMPIYNGQAYLKEAVNSILEQSYSTIELIVINDGSTDASLSLINSFTDTRIKVINFEVNKGLIAALNAGLQAAQGEYIARMDADDIADAKRIEKQVQYFKSNPNIIACDSDYFNLSGTSKNLSSSIYQGDTLKGMLIFTTCFCHPAVMMRNVFKEKQLYYNADFKHVEDYKLWCDLAALGAFGHVQEPLLHYRSHSQQVSNLHHTLQLEKSAQIRREYLNSLAFLVSDEQLKTINFIGDNEFIRSVEQLQKIEKILLHLQAENRRTNRLSQKEFDVCLNKFWFDSCGYSNLGLTAFRAYFKSVLSIGNSAVPVVLRLLIKCLLRRRLK